MRETIHISAAVKEGSPDTGPPFIEIAVGTLEDGREICVYLNPRRIYDYRLEEGYSRCFDEATKLQGLIDEKFESVTVSVYRPGA